MASQSDLIGDHPIAPDQFGRWLLCNDVEITAGKCHRSLSSIVPTDDAELIEWLARHLLDHHYTEYRVNKLREKYGELGFSKYAEQHRKLPTVDKTKKGNATEILLVEYVSSSLKKDLIKVFKLKYNPNVEQAMKGDDTLMIDLAKDGELDQVKIYLGESKFRSIPDKAVITEIMESLKKEKSPISFSYLVEELAKNPDTLKLADEIDKLIIEEIKGNGGLIYAGFLLSNTDTFDRVEEHLNSDNPSLVFISVGVENPKQLIDKAFERAEEIIQTGKL